ncbi:MAG: recombination mediator RecR [Acholeplasmatales bacterium]|nr:recombination mediator RecR [Acholeplasmatales bacterium]
MYPKTLNNIINYLAKLPGVGKISAERMALHLFSTYSASDLAAFGQDLINLKSLVRYCKVCHNLTEGDKCTICANEKRDQTTIMIVKEPKDLYLIEQTNKYQGLYHVLGNLIDITRGKTAKDLKLDSLTNRLQNNVKEIILALDTTLEGEITSAFLKKYVAEINPAIVITRISYGIPLNIDFKYVDVNTLLMSIEKRIKY